MKASQRYRSRFVQRASILALLFMLCAVSFSQRSAIKSVVKTLIPAAEAASCRGASCTGQDPQNTGCSADGRDTYAFTQSVPGLPPAGNLYVEERYSPTCQAAWARFTLESNWDCPRSSGPQCSTMTITDMSAEVYSGRNTEYYDVGWPYVGERAWTNMLDTSYHPFVTLCGWFTIENSGGPGTTTFGSCPGGHQY
jgi:hypothetical protein